MKFKRFDIGSGPSGGSSSIQSRCSPNPVRHSSRIFWTCEYHFSFRVIALVQCTLQVGDCPKVPADRCQPVQASDNLPGVNFAGSSMASCPGLDR